MKPLLILKNRTKGGEKNVIVMYICKDNLTPLLYSGKIKKLKKEAALEFPLWLNSNESN